MCWPSTSASAIRTILWYRSLAMSKSSPMPVPKAVISAWTSSLPSARSSRARSTLRILPRIGRIAWVRGLRPRTAEPPAESPSTMKTSHSTGSFDWQSRSLPGMPPDSSRPLRRVASRALRAAIRAADAWIDLRMMSRASVGCDAEPVAELVVDDLLHERLGLGVAELRLGLALELRLAELDRDDRGQALADVVAGEVLVLLLEEALLPRVAVDQRGHRRAEALLVRAALGRGDRVRVGVHGLRVGVGPLQGDLDGDPPLGVLGLEVDDLGVHELDLLGRVEVLDVVDQAAVVPVGDGRGPVTPLPASSVTSSASCAASRPASVISSSVPVCCGRSSVSVIARPLLRNAICWNRDRRVSKS